MTDSGAIKQFVNNRYRFLTFSERLSKVSVDAVHRIQRVKRLDETEDSSLFAEEINKWKFLDKTIHFTNFLKEIQNVCQNYKMIVHYKEKIVAALKKHLLIPNTQALHALTESVSALCGDLGSDFYSYVADFFKIFSKILHTKDLDKMEWVFICISKLFKHLWKYMLSDMNNVLEMYSEFLCGGFPIHITTFAAESVSFLMRKCPDVQGVFKILFHFLKSYPASNPGVSHVIASMLKGTKGRLHSCHEQILQIIFQFMYKDELGSNICKCIADAMEHIADHINVSVSCAITKALLRETTNIAEKCDASIVSWYVLDLAISWCRHKNGNKIGEISPIIYIIENTMKYTEINVQTAVLNLCSVLLLSSKIEMSEDQRKKILKFVEHMSRLPFKTVSSFWQNLFVLFPGYQLLKESFLKFCRRNLDKENSLNIVVLVTSYILHSAPVSLDAKAIKEFNSLSVDISPLCQPIKGVAVISDLIENTLSMELSGTEELCWCCLKILIHTEKTFQEKFVSNVVKLLKAIGEKNCGSNVFVEKELVLMKTCVEFLAIARPKSLIQSCKPLLGIFEQYSNNLNVVLALNIILTLCPAFVKNIQNTKVFENIIKNLSDSDFNLRRISLSCLNCIEKNDLLEICLSAEATPATLQLYRGRLLHVSKLRKCEDAKDIIKEAVFRFLLGNLYINLTPYWPTVQTIIATCLSSDEQKFYWNIFLGKLDEATNDAKNCKWWLSQKKVKIISKNSEDRPNPVHLTSVYDVYNKFSTKSDTAIQINSKPDFFTYRLLLWSTLLKVETLSNVREEILSFFYKYLENEHFLADTERATFQDVSIKNKIPCNEDGLVKQKHLAIKTLDTLLTVMESLKNPGAYANSKKLKTVYYSFLSHDSANIQKRALNCATGFYRKNFGELKEYLVNLLDDQKLKEAAIGNQLNDIDEKRKIIIVPIILRILYGKLLSNEKVRSGGKGYAKIRRGIVLKFLARFSLDEIKQFMDLILQPLICFENTVQGNYDITKIVPLTKQLGVINTLCIVTTKYSNLISNEVYGKILFICINLLSLHFHLINLIDEKDSQIDSTILPFVKKLCKKTYKLVSSVIEYWPISFSLSDVLLDRIFNTIVSPNVCKLKHECLNQPNALFNLLIVFAKQDRFSSLLRRKVPGFENCIHAIMDILTSEHVTNAGAKNVMEFLKQILPEEEDPAENSSMIDLVVPHCNIILDYFVSKLSTKKNDSVLQNLPVLRILGKFIENSELSQNFAELLLSQICDITKRKKRSAQAEERKNEKSVLPLLQVLETVASHEVLIQKASRLFMILDDRKCRRSLVNVFATACDAIKHDSHGDRMRWCATMISQLNAWDKHSIDEIDFDTRLNGFEEIQKYFQQDQILNTVKEDNLFVMPILYCSIHTLFNYHQDISLRECASRNIEQFCQIAAKDAACFHDIINVVLETCKLGVNSAHGTVRQEVLRVLSSCVKLFPDDKVLNGLAILRNESDPDSDFFENICHLQMHRRTRALRKLADILDDNSTVISHKVVQSYLTPIAVQILKTESLEKYQHLEIECLRVITSSVRIMPWSDYKSYLNLTMQWVNRDLTSMKIICAVLDGFNVDLSKLERKLTKQDKNETSDSSDATKLIDGETTMTGDENLIEIYNVITKSIFPRLTEGLSAKLSSDDSHKMADKTSFTDLEQCEMRSLLALAVAKVLKKFPDFVMNEFVPRIMLKLLVFLRHRYSDVRQVACKSTSQIAVSIGAAKFNLILSQLKNGLCKGYQKHVLVYTIFHTLIKLEDTLIAGDLENCLKSLLPVLSENLFGTAEAERNIGKITSKIPEAKGRSKALGVYRILAKFTPVHSLLEIIKPLNQNLEGVNSHKTKLKVEQVLSEVCDGLLDNSSLTHEDMLVFVHGIISRNISNLFKEKLLEKKTGEVRQESCLILNDQPVRYDAQAVATMKRTNLHVIVEFALKLLNTLLKRNYHLYREYVHMLDPLVPMLITCVDSPYNKTVSESIRCFSKFLGLGLPAISTHFETLAKSLFVILRQNSKGMGSEEIASASFKTLSIMCLGEHGAKLSHTQLEILLAYAESDLYNTQRQGVAFNLIKSILSRGLKGREVNEVMDKVRKIAIQTQDTSTMMQARHTYVYYLMNYSFKEKKLMQQVSFILAQFNFEYETGRLSAMELIASLISNFPKNILKSLSALIYVSTATVLVNDSSPKCKKFASELLKNLLRKVEVSDRDQFLDMVLQWYSHKDRPNEQKLASILIGIFAEVFGATIMDKYIEILPHIHESIENTITMQNEDEENTAIVDHALFHQFNAFYEISKSSKLFENKMDEKIVSMILKLVEENLLHPHDWVRVSCSQIFGAYFNVFAKPENFVSRNRLEYAEGSMQEKLENLANIFCKQLRSENIHQQLTVQIVKNLLFVIKCLHVIVTQQGEKNCEEEDCLMRILRLVVSSAKHEIAYNSHCTDKRTIVIKLCSAVAMSFPKAHQYLEIIVEPLFRECDKKTDDKEESENLMALKSLANEALELIKGVVGSDAFIAAYANVKRRISNVRVDRKRKKATLIISNPQIAIAKKVKHNLKKKESKKRKIARQRPSYKAKKKKTIA